MSFTFRINQFVVLEDNLRLRGRIVDGHYWGPQPIRLTSTNGEQRTVAISRSNTTTFTDLPITAEYRGLLYLHINALPPPFSIDTSRLVEGVGPAPRPGDSRLLISPRDGTMPAREFDERFLDWKQRAVDLDFRIARKIKKFPVGKISTVGEIRVLFDEIIEHFERMNDLQRQSIIGFLSENCESLMYRAEVSGSPKTEDGFRKRILLFVIDDHGKDTRDAILALSGYRKMGEKSGFDVDKIFRQAAPLASDIDKYGWGSTRSLLLGS